MHDHPDFPAVQGGMNYGSWNLHLYYLHKYLCNWKANTKQCISGGLIIGFFFCLQVDGPIFWGGELISGGWGLVIACIFLCTGVDQNLKGRAYKQGWGLIIACIFFVYRYGPISQGGGAYKWGVGAYNRMYLFVYRYMDLYLRGELISGVGAYNRMFVYRQMDLYLEERGD